MRSDLPPGQDRCACDGAGGAPDTGAPCPATAPRFTSCSKAGTSCAASDDVAQEQSDVAQERSDGIAQDAQEQRGDAGGPIHAPGRRERRRLTRARTGSG
ncbi:hypothetical protein [Sorangium sp. So ce1389]|uniref:hypothetical protein n=1 Tax=Sorangium sp. So ce1389 TaxID=3133336 RepID=UPI003F62B61D